MIYLWNIITRNLHVSNCLYSVWQIPNFLAPLFFALPIFFLFLLLLFFVFVSLSVRRIPRPFGLVMRSVSRFPQTREEEKSESENPNSNTEKTSLFSSYGDRCVCFKCCVKRDSIIVSREMYKHITGTIWSGMQHEVATKGGGKHLNLEGFFPISNLLGNERKCPPNRRENSLLFFAWRR